MWTDEKFQEYDEKYGDVMDGEMPDDYIEFLEEALRRQKEEKQQSAQPQ